MMTLLSDGLAKAAAGVTSLAEVWRVVSVERAQDTNGSSILEQGDEIGDSRVEPETG
jgi:hypothetical protein